MVECTALEMRHTGNRIGGSNPSLSANSNQFGTADKDAIAQRTLSASAGAERRPIAPNRVLTGR